MSTHNSELNSNKYLLVWSNPIPNKIQALLTMVFVNTFGLIGYIKEHSTITDKIYLIVPLNGLRQLLNDEIHMLNQVIRIDVIYENLNDKIQFQSRFTFNWDKIQCWPIKNLEKLWDKYADEKNLNCTSSSNKEIKDSINAIMKEGLATNESDIRHQRSQIAKQLPTTILHGFSAKNSFRLNSSHVCQCCKLICLTSYQLTCGHRICATCVHIRTK